jgi:ribosomal subunit interface protein
MAISIGMSFRNLDRSEIIENQVKERCLRLELLCDEVTHCQVVISGPYPHKKKGNPYGVHLELSVPGTEVAVTHNAGVSKALEDFYVALQGAFDTLECHLNRWKEKRRHYVQVHSRLATP